VQLAQQGYLPGKIATFEPLEAKAEQPDEALAGREVVWKHGVVAF
jgi:hypothetical protein